MKLTEICQNMTSRVFAVLNFRFRFLHDSIVAIGIGFISVSVLKICARTVGSSVSVRTDPALADNDLRADNFRLYCMARINVGVRASVRVCDCMSG